MALGKTALDFTILAITTLSLNDTQRSVSFCWVSHFINKMPSAVTLIVVILSVILQSVAAFRGVIELTICQFSVNGRADLGGFWANLCGIGRDWADLGGIGEDFLKIWADFYASK